MEENEKPKSQKGTSAIGIWLFNKIVAISNRTIGRLLPSATITPKTRKGTPQETIAFQQYNTLIKVNNGVVGHLKNYIENQWAQIEGRLFGSEELFGGEEFQFEPKPKSDQIFSDVFRKIEYFRDIENTLNEAKIFTTEGTIDLEYTKVPLNIPDLKNRAQKKKDELEKKRRDKGSLEDSEQKLLDDTSSFLLEIEKKTFEFKGVPSIKIGARLTTFIDGRQENIVAMGKKIDEVKKQFAIINSGINVLAATSKFSAQARAEVGDMMKEMLGSLDDIKKKEEEHGKKLGEIHSALTKLNEYIISPQGELEDIRPLKNTIRFLHTYKIIKPFYLKEVTEKIKSTTVDGSTNEEEVTHKVPIYFNPENNPYMQELKEINVKIKMVKENELNNELSTFEKSLVRIETKINELRNKKDKFFEDYVMKILRSSNTENEIKNRLNEKKLKEFLSVFKEMLSRIDLFSSNNFAKQEKDLYNEILNKLSNFKEIDDQVIQILETLQDDPEVTIKAIFQLLIKIKNYEQKLYQSISDIKEKIKSVKMQLNERQKLVFRKEQLELYIKTLTPRHEHFYKLDDEVDWGVDENNWPLEAFEMPEKSGDWYVLTDKWWVEISENSWQRRTILRKNGGKKIWQDKVISGVKKSRNAIKYRKGWIRKVPAEFVGDLDPLEKMSFISNEYDAYRDDFRDGRYHPHSKTSMDYIVAANPLVEDIADEKERVVPYKPITYHIDVEDHETRIKFRPIYYTDADIPSSKFFEMLPDDIQKRFQKRLSKLGWKKLLGEVHPTGGLGVTDWIPEDERKVSRRYVLSTNFSTFKNKVRKPTHLNPAFDRVALECFEQKFIHWGRMLYYETPDGINRWSENPFPHISSRGFAKYLINLVINRSFSFSDARETLKHGEWDFGVRHYGGPFTTDPLGPVKEEGGALWHAMEVARRKGWK